MQSRTTARDGALLAYSRPASTPVISQKVPHTLKNLKKSIYLFYLFEIGSHCAALTSLGTHYVENAGLEYRSLCCVKGADHHAHHIDQFYGTFSLLQLPFLDETLAVSS